MVISSLYMNIGSVQYSYYYSGHQYPIPSVAESSQKGTMMWMDSPGSELARGGNQTLGPGQIRPAASLYL
eukprot:6197032-Pleurochrysis_carterae.AAC.3